MSFLKVCVRVFGVSGIVILTACSSSSSTTSSSGDGGGGGGTVHECCIAGAFYGCSTLDEAKACFDALDGGVQGCTRDPSSDSKCG